MPKPRRKTTGGVGNDSAGMANDTGAVATLTAPQNSGDTTVNIDRELVARRAYELYLARGGSDGQAMDDWLAAERELRRRGEAPMGEP
jgi:hypothetical protein